MALALVGKQVDVAFYARQAERHGGTHALVLGCANGRIAFELAGKGQKVTAVDPSARMVASAEERQAQEPSGADITFLNADLRSLRLEVRFRVVIAPQNAIALMPSLGDLGALLATVRAHLEPAGAFLFDVANPAASALPPPRERSDEVPGMVEPLRPLFTPHLRERRRPDKESAPIHRLRLRLFEPRELDEALSEADLVAYERFGSFDGKPFDDGDAVQIVVAGFKR